jgi:hypothetical protein
MFTDVSEVLAASIVREMSKSGSSILELRIVSCRPDWSICIYVFVYL